MTQEKLEQIGAILNNEENAKALAATETADEAVTWFAAQGVEVTGAEISEFAAGAAAAGQESDLDENSLENVTGGVSLGTLPLAAFMFPPFVRNTIASWGVKVAERLLKIDINGDGKIG